MVVEVEVMLKNEVGHGGDGRGDRGGDGVGDGNGGSGGSGVLD